LYESCNNQIPDAIDAYTRALELDPNNAQIKQRLNALKESQSGQKTTLSQNIPKITLPAVPSSGNNTGVPPTGSPPPGIFPARMSAADGTGNINAAKQPIQRLSVPAEPLRDMGKPNSTRPIPKIDAGQPDSSSDSSQKPADA
jgi:hypothetical protein